MPKKAVKSEVKSGKPLSQRSGSKLSLTGKLEEPEQPEVDINEVIEQLINDSYEKINAALQTRHDNLVFQINQSQSKIDGKTTKKGNQ